MTWTIARWENQGDAAFAGVLDIHAENARIEPTTTHDVDISVLAMSIYISTRYVYLY
jgi:hypothetical protein